MFKPSVGYVLMAGVLSFAFINAASAEPPFLIPKQA